MLLQKYRKYTVVKTDKLNKQTSSYSAQWDVNSSSFAVGYLKKHLEEDVTFLNQL